MGTHCHVAVPGTDAGIIRARYVHFDGNPAAILPALRAICAHTFGHDTAALTEALLATDWTWLGPDTTDTTPANVDGERPVPGVGMALDAATAPETGPVTVALADLAGLDTVWVYVIDPATDTVAVHSGAGDHVGDHHLHH